MSAPVDPPVVVCKVSWIQFAPHVCFCKIRFNVPSAAWSSKRCSSLPVFRPIFRGTFPASPQLNTAYWDVFMTEAFFTALGGQEVFFSGGTPPPSQNLLMLWYFRDIFMNLAKSCWCLYWYICGLCQRCQCWLLTLAGCAYEAAVPVIWAFLVPLLLVAPGSLKTDWPEHRKCICMCMSLVLNCKNGLNLLYM